MSDHYPLDDLPPEAQLPPAVQRALLDAFDRDVIRWEQEARHWYLILAGDDAPHRRRPHPDVLAMERHYLERINPDDPHAVERELARMAAESAARADAYCWGPDWCYLTQALAAHCGISPGQVKRMTWEEIAAALRQAVERRRPPAELQAHQPGIGAATTGIPDAPPTPPASPSDGQDAPAHPDGTEGGCWLWWKGKRHDVPKGVVFLLLAYMWDKDSASYDALVGPVFEVDVAPGTIRGRKTELNKVLRKIGIPWQLRTDSKSRQLTKHPAD